MDAHSRLGADRPLVGMVHLPPLPGAPGYDGTPGDGGTTGSHGDGGREAIRERAVADAEALAAGGMDAVLVENYGDAPFYAEDVPAHVVAEMTAAVRAVRAAVDCPVGVNVLRNDAEAAVSTAAAAGGSFVRVNVHTGAAVTDQGVIEGRAAETLRLRERIDADVAVLADVGVKHAAPLGGRPLDERVADAVERGGADAVVTSGTATGEATPTETVEGVVAARDAVDPEVPVLVGSGVTPQTVAETLELADGAIVGTACKAGGETAAPVDVERVERLVAAARA